MPWGGRSTIAVSAKQDVQGTIKLRIPGWAVNRPVPSDLYSYADRSSAQPSIAVNGKEVSAVADRSGYVSLDGTWKTGDKIEVTFPVEVRRVIAHPSVKENRRRVAVERGPIVYCAEWPDVEGGKALELLVDAKAPLTPSVDQRFYGGVTVIHTRAHS